MQNVERRMAAAWVIGGGTVSGLGFHSAILGYNDVDALRVKDPASADRLEEVCDSQVFASSVVLATVVAAALFLLYSKRRA